MSAFAYKTIMALGLGLLAWLGTDAAARGETLVLLSLTCHEPEDANWDEPELVVVTRGFVTNFYLDSMSRGSIEPAAGEIGRVIMGIDATVNLFDRDNGRNDWFDSDDHLGRRTIHAVATNGVRSVTFRGDGADYTLRYRVNP
jgi:hypothetical protein